MSVQINWANPKTTNYFHFTGLNPFRNKKKLITLTLLKNEIRQKGRVLTLTQNASPNRPCASQIGSTVQDV